MEDKLITKAIEMLERAYVPYSHFPVGAALECADGSVYTGCNVENASYGLCICAERTAAVKAVSGGHRNFKRIVIAGNSEDYCTPCGACRQFLYEFAPGMEVICLNAKREAMKTTLSALLPHGFGPEHL
ncbi:MAG: cytidine deaminase [Oscillospiraceae bacterium]|nr:cytidine deaminase [Oscillospiraceae bacterium]